MGLGSRLKTSNIGNQKKVSQQCLTVLARHRRSVTFCKAFGAAASSLRGAVNKAPRTWYSGDPAGCTTIKMTNRTFRALRFSKSAGMSDRCGAAHLADFTIPFWIDATDAGTLFAQKFALVTAVALESFGIFLSGRRPSIDLLHKFRGLRLIARVIQVVPGPGGHFRYRLPSSQKSTEKPQ